MTVHNRHARCFSVASRGQDRLVSVFGPGGDRDTIATYFVGEGDPQGFSTLPILDRVAVLSTTHLPFLSALGRSGHVVAAVDLPRVRDAATRERIATGDVIDVAAADGINRERLLASRAVAMFDYPFGQQVQRSPLADIMFIPVTEYLEEHPLGRAEWIRFFGVLFGEENKADSLFMAMCERYERAKELVENEHDRPRVFFGSSWQGQWHVPPGNSCMARLIADAGGEYAFMDRSASGNIPIDLETVLATARTCDHFGAVLSHGGEVRAVDVAGGDPRVSTLPVLERAAFYLDSEGTDIFGQAMLEPDVLLADLVSVFHRSKFTGPRTYVFETAQ